MDSIMRTLGVLQRAKSQDRKVYAVENGATNAVKYYTETFYTCDFFLCVEGLEGVALACCSVRQLQLS